MHSKTQLRSRATRLQKSDNTKFIPKRAETRMNILLINPATAGYSRSVTTPLGLLSIASVLQAKGHKVRLYDRTVEKVRAEKVFKEFSPELIGISLVSFKSVTDALELSEYAKKSGLPVIWGGPLASEIPETVLKEKNVDMVSIGEGEATWVELAEKYSKSESDFSSVAGLAIKGDNGKIILTAQREFIDLGDLPPVDWSLIDVPKYFQSSYECSKMLYLYCAKGCPHNCAFCYNKHFHRSVYRKRPLEAVLDEIKFLVENYGMDGVYFADEMWGRSRTEMRQICNSLRSLKLDFVWGCQTRIGVFNEDDFKYMYDSGCRWVFFGVESGSKKVLESMNKQIPFDKIEKTFSDCKKAGIVTIASFIVGFPDETVEDLAKTVELIEKLETPLINLNHFALVPGSDIYGKMISESRYREPSDLAQLKNIKPIERNEYDFTSVPKKDLSVIRSWYMWRSFSAKDVSSDTKNFSFAKKVATDAIRQLTRSKPKDFIFSMISSAFELFSIIWYAHAYPKIIKKYGISK